MDGSRVRKPLDKLTVADLERFAVWEFVLDEEGHPGQDETTVRPMAHCLPLKVAPGTIIRATAKLADGTAMIGFVIPGSEDWTCVADIQPVILCRTNPVGFWLGATRPSRAELDGYYAMLGKRPAEIFPLAFESSVPLARGRSVCVVNGFCYLGEDDETITVV